MDKDIVILYMREALLSAKRTHTCCEDGFYSCPKDPDYFGNDTSGECTCGAEELNSMLDAVIRLADDALGESE